MKTNQTPKEAHVFALTKAKKGTHTPIDLYESRTQAGFPSPADDLVEERLDINTLLIKRPEATFFVKVEGDSMEGAGIFSGDILVVDRSVEPRNASIVIAAVNGELTVKRLVIKESTAGKHITLVAENDNYEPIKITDDLDTVLWGVVTASVRRF